MLESKVKSLVALGIALENAVQMAVEEIPAALVVRLVADLVFHREV